jgi:hypothetical protein
VLGKTPKDFMKMGPSADRERASPGFCDLLHMHAYLSWGISRRRENRRGVKP